MKLLALSFPAILACILLSGCGFSKSGPDGSGTIECTQVRVSSEVAGRLQSLSVSEGDFIKKDVVVARIDPSTYQLKLDEARAAATLAGQDLKRIKGLHETRSVTEQQVDTIKAVFDQASARLAIADKNVIDCSVRAPMDGVVSVKSAEAGEMVNPGTTLLTLSRLDEVWLSVYIPESRLASIKLGQPALVKVDGYPDKIKGTVTFISSVAEFSPKNVQTADERAKLVFRIKITVSNANGTLKPGMPADAWLDTGK